MGSLAYIWFDSNFMLLSSLLTLEPAFAPQVLFDKGLKPGGVYFVEDMEVSRVKKWLDPEPEGVVMVSCMMLH
jgi:hypothetical protein